jgi:hypothetical protein
MIQKSAGLHPDSQRLLWALAYNQSQQFENRKPYQQLEKQGFINRIDKYDMDEHWEITQLGVSALQSYAPFLKRLGLNCPPNI